MDDKVYQLELPTDIDNFLLNTGIKFCGVDMPVTRICLDISTDSTPILVVTIPFNRVELVCSEPQENK